MQLIAQESPVDVCLVIKQRLEELGLEQRDLAAAAEVTESYISQLLTRKKLPPEPGRTDIYDKMGKFLKLPSGKLAKLADHQRKEELKRNLDDPPKPLFREVRELILRKCASGKEKQVRVIFEKQPFGELERLVTQKLLDLVKKVARDELESETWLRSVARLKEFLRHQSASGDATEEEIEFLKRLRFDGKRPTPLYYYRELQNLRDPLHFRSPTAQPLRKKTLGQSQPEGSVAPMHKYLEADGIEKQMQLNGRKKAIQRWAGSRGKTKKQRSKPGKVSQARTKRLL